MEEINYQVLGSRDLQELEDGVNELMQHGWVPIGGITEIRSTYRQAMIRVPKPADYDTITRFSADDPI